MPAFTWCLLCVLVASTARGDPCMQPDATLTQPSLKVMSLNIAHGRSDGPNQLFQDEHQHRRNLDRVADLLRRVEADVVALQEADAPSRWSGRFDHVDYVAERTAYPCVHHGIHAQGTLFEFGTALMSRHAFARALTFDFAPTPPTTTKGFVIGGLRWVRPLDEEPAWLTVVSVHLDFSRQSVRREQFQELLRQLSGIGPPMIVMGDFNSTWDDGPELLREFAQDLGLHAYRPGARNLGTYANRSKRLDWILISDDLHFASFEVRPETVSDHHAIVAVVEPAAAESSTARSTRP